MVNLVQKSDYWLVVHVVKQSAVNDRFPTIEAAADFMMKLGVQDDEIDYALCEMVAYGHTRAIFVDKGLYSHSEEA